MESLHPGVALEEVRDQTGFELLLPDMIPLTPVPTPEQVRLLRERIDPEGEYITPPQPTGAQG